MAVQEENRKREQEADTEYENAMADYRQRARDAAATIRKRHARQVAETTWEWKDSVVRAKSAYDAEVEGEERRYVAYAAALYEQHVAMEQAWIQSNGKEWEEKRSQWKALCLEIAGRNDEAVARNEEAKQVAKTIQDRNLERQQQATAEWNDLVQQATQKAQREESFQIEMGEWRAICKQVEKKNSLRKEEAIVTHNARFDEVKQHNADVIARAERHFRHTLKKWGEKWAKIESQAKADHQEARRRAKEIAKVAREVRARHRWAERQLVGVEAFLEVVGQAAEGIGAAMANAGSLMDAVLASREAMKQWDTTEGGGPEDPNKYWQSTSPSIVSKLPRPSRQTNRHTRIGRKKLYPCSSHSKW